MNDFASEELKAYIRAVNKSHTEGLRLYPLLSEVFRPFVGQKINKADGDLLLSIKKLLPQLPYDNFVRVSRSGSEYSLAWNIHVSELYSTNSGYSSSSYDIAIYIGNIRDGVLIDLCAKFSARTDYTVEEVMEKHKVVKEAEKALQQAKSALWPFDCVL